MNRVSSFVSVIACLVLLGSGAIAHSSPGAQPVSDSQITDQVVAAVRRTAPNLVRLEVNTKDGVVTVSGQARSAQAAMNAIQAAQSVPGVTKVRNKLSLAH